MAGLRERKKEFAREAIQVPREAEELDGPVAGAQGLRHILTSLVAAGSAQRPEVSGWRRVTSAICEEYARKLLRERCFRWSQVWSLGTVNPSRKLRRFEGSCCRAVTG
jgi:hypothetical protein